MHMRGESGMPHINKWEKPFHIERGDVYMADLGSEGLDDETRGSRQERGSQQAGVLDFLLDLHIQLLSSQLTQCVLLLFLFFVSFRKRPKRPFPQKIYRKRNLSLMVPKQSVLF